MKTYVGLDLSLTSTGGVALPAGWGGDFSLVERMNVGEDLHDDSDLSRLARRTSTVAEDVADWIFWLSDGDPERVRVWVEDLPHFGKGVNVKRVIDLAMLRGVVQHLLAPFHIYLEPLNVATCRKTLLGYVPPGKGKAKARTVSLVRDISGGDDSPFESDDELDAFAVLNHACSLVGEFFYTLPRPK